MSDIKNVAIVGANGNLGAVILKTLLDAGAFQVTVLKRASSRAQPELDPAVRLVEVSDAWTTEELTVALKGQDAAIATWPLHDVSHHLRFADAAAAAGVRRFIPADYGSVDARSPYARELVKLFDNKVKVRERLEELAVASGGAFSWTSLVNGHFFDWGLTNGFLRFYPDEKRAEILGDGKAKSSNATLGQVSKAVLRVLEKPDETKDRVLMLQSFCVSQLDVLQSLERVTGEKWTADYVEIDEYINKYKAAGDAGDKGAIDSLVFALGVIDGNWEEKEDFAMDLLGLENEDLDTVVKEALAQN